MGMNRTTILKIMKSMRHIFAWAVLLCASAACTREPVIQQSSGATGADGADMPDGYFEAVFMAGNSDVMTRTAVNGETDRIQTLRYIIYRKDGDEYYRCCDRTVFSPSDYDVAENHMWPLEYRLSEILPCGEYRVVFIGNADPALFKNQSGIRDTEPVLINTETYSGARIFMPSSGPASFTGTNMYYMDTEDFSDASPSVHILMQRIVSSNVFKRNFVDMDHAVSTLVDDVVLQIDSGQLTEDVVRGLLDESLGGALGTILGPVGDLLQGVTAIVDRILDAIAGKLLERLNEMLVHELVTAIENSLFGAIGSSDRDLASQIFNPWTGAEYATITADIPMSIGFDMTEKTTWQQKKWKVHLEKETVAGDESKYRTAQFFSLPGNMNLTDIDIEKEDMAVGSAIANLDGKLLNGLLVNIKTPLEYGQTPNLQYRTEYDFVRLSLADKDLSGEKITLTTDLAGILTTEELLQAILGDNPLTDAISGIVTPLLGELLETIEASAVKPLELELPDLGINNITVEGRWNETYDSMGNIVSKTE